MLVDECEALLKEAFKVAFNPNEVVLTSSYNTVDHLVSHYREDNPDLVILDAKINSASLNGLESCKSLISEVPGAKVVFYSDYSSDYIIHRAYKLGAKAFIKKTDAIEDLRMAMEMAKDSNDYYTDEIAQRMVRYPLNNGFDKLKENEMSAFLMVAKGMLNSEIARELNVSPRSVVNILKSVRAKLKIERAVDFTIMAVKNHMISVQ